MTASNTSDKHSSKSLTVFGMYLAMVILGAILSFTAIRLFPAQFLPQDVYQRPEKFARVPAIAGEEVKSQTTEQHNFVVATVIRIF